MTTPTMTWTRLARRLGTDHNPLRRRSDLVEAWLLPAAIAAFLALSPLIAGGAILLARADNAATRQAQLALHSVPAVLLAPVPGPMRASSGSWLTPAAARWTAGGRQHAGDIPAPAGSREGATVPVWLNRAGQVQPPPLTAAQATDRIIVSASLALAALALLLGGLALTGRLLLYRRRLADWDTAWLSVGPLWSRLE